MTINATSGDHLLNGTAYVDQIDPGAGNHIVYAGAGDDNVGAGNHARTASAALTVTTPALAPTALDLATSDDTGASSINNISKNTSTLTFSGVGEDGDAVTVAEVLLCRGPVIRMKRHGELLVKPIRILESKFEASR